MLARKYICVGIVTLMGWGCAPEQVKPQKVAPAKTVESLGRTIGELCELVGYENVQVSGFALVVGLHGTGSSECPSRQREYLLKELRRTEPQKYMEREYMGMTAEELIASRNTAVVEVSGSVPGGAPAGTAFDISVSVVRATQTTSLQGGYLLEADLRLVVPGYRGMALAGRNIGVAEGPIFINPFPLKSARADEAGEAIVSDPRRGVVLGGGRTLADRKVRLAIVQPGYRLAQQIQGRINARFTDDESWRVASATRGSVNLRIPATYRDRYEDFFRLLRVLYLDDYAGYLELRLKELMEIAQEPGADYEAISLAWEAIGRTALKPLRKLYEKHDGELAFYAAQTAVNLADWKAIDALAAMALDPKHPARLRAAKGLGKVAGDPRARATLSQLLGEESTRLRLLGYNGLRRVGDPRIKSVRLPGGFTVDSIETAGENIVCVWARGEPRLVLMGKDLACRNNAFYESLDGKIIVNVGPSGGDVTVTREEDGGRTFISAKSGLNVKDLVTTLALPVQPLGRKARSGIGLNFSEIVGVLYGLCGQESQVIPARFILHRRADDLLD